jgi:hypothetical protein
MKCAFVSALVFATASAYSAEFIQGCETGLFLGDEESFADYNCQMPTMDKEAKAWIEMLNPVRVMVESMNGGQPSVLMDSLASATQQIAILYSLFFSEYDGGDFCQGLIFSKEMASVFWAFGRSLFESSVTGPETSAVQEYLVNPPVMQEPAPVKKEETLAYVEKPAYSEVRHGRRK